MGFEKTPAADASKHLVLRWIAIWENSLKSSDHLHADRAVRTNKPSHFIRNKKERKTGRPLKSRSPCLIDTLCGSTHATNFSLQSIPRLGFYGPKRKSQAEAAEFVTVLVTLSDLRITFFSL